VSFDSTACGKPQTLPAILINSLMKLIFFLVAVFFFSSSHAQVSNVHPSDISGKWKLSRYTITKNGVVVDDSLRGRSSSFLEFFSNGTYRSIERNNNSQFTTKGKWKIMGGAKKLHLSNNVDVPDDPKVEIADHDMDIVLINGTLYITYTCRDCSFSPATDYYKKQ